VVPHHAADAPANGAKYFGGRQAVHAALNSFALHMLLDARNAYLEEFVEVGSENAEKLHALQQWILRVHRFVEHALIESSQLNSRLMKC
jgi:hypothetical protein